MASGTVRHATPDGPTAQSWPSLDRLTNVPNTITTVRTVGAVVLALVAISGHGVGWAVAAYLTYWVGDFLDGWAARRLDQETRFGAVYDVLADRLCCGLCIVPLIMLRPGMWLPCAVFLVQFMLIDLALTLSFLRWPLPSPNYFYLVHRGLYRWNWSPPAKALNTSALVLLVIVAPTPWLPLSLAVAVAVTKLVSLLVAYRLPATGDVPPGSGRLTAGSAPLRPLAADVPGTGGGD